VQPDVTEDLEIVGFQEDEGRLKGTLGSLHIIRKGVEISVGGISDELRDFIWSHCEKLTGTCAEVKYQQLSPDNKLLFPRIVRLRPDKS
jgi:ATP-dependent DNA ligase